MKRENVIRYIVEPLNRSKLRVWRVPMTIQRFNE
jgi:hypothetical protein